MSSREARRDDGQLDLVRRYLDEVGTVPLLTAAEEVDLAKRIEAGLYAAELLRRADQPDPERDADLAAVAEAGRRAKDRMIRANLRLVVSVVRRHPRRALPLLDAIQEGNLGLIRAVEKFDYTKGYKFSTYATWWIRQALARGTAQQSRIVHLPVHLTEELNKLDRLERELALRLGRHPGREELAGEAGIAADRIDELRRAGRDPLSLDAPLDEDGELRLVDVVTDVEAGEVDDAVSRAALSADVRCVVATLPPREALVLSRRFGLADGETHTLREISDELGLSRERVRQIERHGLAMLRTTERCQVLLSWAG